MLAFFAALLAAAPSPILAAPVDPAQPLASSDSSDILESAVPWWERITVTVDDKGEQQSCRYETSASQKGGETCGKAMAASVSSSGKGPSGLFTKLTFERRFSPGGRLDAGKLQPGDTLLGRQVLFLTIDAKGSIASCKIVATAGDAKPDHDCDKARKEQFRAPASPAPAARQAFMNVLAYGHTERVA